MEDGTIQIAPLAYMRGRTLDQAFVILDEAQNATNSQFKMFLTRMLILLSTGLPASTSGSLKLMYIGNLTKGVL